MLTRGLLFKCCTSGDASAELCVLEGAKAPPHPLKTLSSLLILKLIDDVLELCWLLTLFSSSPQVVKYWEAFLPEAKAIS